MVVHVRILWKDGRVSRYRWGGGSMLQRAELFTRNGHDVVVEKVVI